MQKIILLIGSIFILFSFIFIGFGACSKDDDDNGDDSADYRAYDDDIDNFINDFFCGEGYLSCSGDYCCSVEYPYTGGSEYCYATLAACQRDNDDCKKCGGGDNPPSCPSPAYKRCASSLKCCRSDYPYFGSNGKCYTSLAACKKKAADCVDCGF